jgi:cobalt-zinc-cadmium efflux system protein
VHPARLADPDEAGLQLDGDTSCEHEPTCLDPCHLRHGDGAKGSGHSHGRATKEAAVREQTERVGVTVEVLQLCDELVVKVRHRRDASLSAVAHDHDHRLIGDRRALTIALVLVVGLMAGEIAAGIVANSLALLADAGHMLTDAAALAFALFASAMAARPAAGRWTFGYSRLEILAAQVNGITLALLAVWIFWSAGHRLADPQEVRGGLVLAVALVGALVSIVASAVLARASRESLNVRGAFLHVLTDVAAFGAAALAGGLILATGWNRLDPIASLLVAALMLWSGAQLLRESTAIFLERAPADIDPEAIGRALVAERDVVEVHDLHVWTVTSGFPALSAHVLVAPDADCHAARRRLEGTLAERFGLRHTTLQVEHVEPATAQVALGDAVARRTPVERR